MCVCGGDRGWGARVLLKSGKVCLAVSVSMETVSKQGFRGERAPVELSLASFTSTAGKLYTKLCLNEIAITAVFR